MLILLAARGVEIIIIGPLPWCAVEKCCTEQGHITNFDDPEYGRLIGEGVKEVGIHLRNLLHTRRIKAAKIVNPAALMGLFSVDAVLDFQAAARWSLRSVLGSF